MWLIVHLLRHGESINNAGELRVPDAPLTALGLEQAAAMAEAWRGVSLDAVLCSSLWRALETAEPFLGTVVTPHVQGWPELAEFNRSYPSDGHASDQVAARFPDVPFDPSLEAVHWPAYPGRETLEGGAARAAALVGRVARVFPPTARIALIGHQGFNGLLLCAWLGAPAQDHLFRQGNCRAHALEISGGRVTLLHANAGPKPSGPKDVASALDIFLVSDGGGAPPELPCLNAVMAATSSPMAGAIARASGHEVTLWQDFTERPEWVWTRLLSEWPTGGRVALISPAAYVAGLLKVACAAPRAHFAVAPGAVSHLRWVHGRFQAWRLNDTGHAGV